MIPLETLTEIAIEVSEGMLGMNLYPRPIAEIQDGYRASLSISGDESLNLHVVFEDTLAEEFAARMFKVEKDTLEPDEVSDAVGEVANMICGNVKGLLSGECTLSTPHVDRTSQDEPAQNVLQEAAFAHESGFLVVRLSQTKTALTESQFH